MAVLSRYCHVWIICTDISTIQFGIFSVQELLTSLNSIGLWKLNECWIFLLISSNFITSFVIYMIHLFLCLFSVKGSLTKKYKYINGKEKMAIYIWSKEKKRELLHIWIEWSIKINANMLCDYWSDYVYNVLININTFTNFIIHHVAKIYPHFQTMCSLRISLIKDKPGNANLIRMK